MRIGINTFLFTSPFTNESTKLFKQFKRWGFDTVEIPDDLRGKAQEYRDKMIEAISEHDDKLFEKKDRTVNEPVQFYVSAARQPYELVAEYGFPIPPRKQVSGSDVIVDRLITRRTAFFINGATTDQRFYELLYHWASDSILACSRAAPNCVCNCSNRESFSTRSNNRDPRGEAGSRHAAFAR